jgi:cold shock CspA family protein/ribosome-associated translation inhibitor RaiA
MVKTANFPVKITFRNLPHSEALAENIEKRAAKLATFYDRITNCEVIVEVPNKPQHQGSFHHIRITLGLPGEELIVDHTPPQPIKYEEVSLAIREAFDEARRQLQDYARLQRGDVKTHEALPQGQVSKLFPQEGYGFIKLADGREIYFHQNSVVAGSFNRLALGTTVDFVEEPGEEGPQATAVQPVD